MGRRFTVSEFEGYLRQAMRMSHIYQPVMLKILLENRGQASTEQIAKELLVHDRSQVEYYKLRTKNMVGKVLERNGVVEPVKEGRRIVGYRLNVDHLAAEDVRRLASVCGEKLDAYLEKHGNKLWSHRGIAEGYVPGSVRYEVLKRAKHRCELCGAHEEQAALHVDHIIPRAKGGSDHSSNFQALCVTCNTNKRDRDDTDFRGVLASYQDREAHCLFCEIPPERIVAQNELCFAIRDGFPVAPLHTLIIPKRHVADYFDVYQPEMNAFQSLLQEQKALIQSLDPEVTGFNVGINAGRDAGQTVFHVHVHLIPRRPDDVAEPRGGVRGVIPSKQRY